MESCEKRVVLILPRSRLTSAALRLAFSLTALSSMAAAQAVQYAEKFAGEDAGAKITACMSALPATGGVCDARQLGGVQRSATGFTVGTPSKPVELLLGSVDLWVNKTIYIQARSSMVGLPSSNGIGVYQGATLIKAADQTNLPVVLEVVGGLAVLQDITVDGNRKNNLRGGAAIRVTSANRSNMFRVTAQNAPGNGIEIYSRKASDSCCAKLQQVMSIYNGESGLAIIATGDVFVSLSEFEENDEHGIDIDRSAGTRIEHSDIGGNREDGVRLHGTPDLPSSNNIIVGNQFGNNYKADVSIEGSNTRYSAIGNLISFNEFLGGAYRDGGRSDAITIVDSSSNALYGNSFFANPGHHYRSCINISGSRAKADRVDNNFCQAADVGGEAGFLVSPTTQVTGNHGTVRTQSRTPQ